MKNVVEPKSALIEIVGASAGTGKTTRLATEFFNAVVGAEGNHPIDPTRIIVCTFTNKAANELSARIRQRLLQAGQFDAAQLVLAGYVGTVNSICGRLLKDYALDCGLSPQQEVIPEEMATNLFSIATAEVIDAFAQRVESIARRLSFFENDSSSKYRRRSHWVEHVRSICTLARANNISASTLLSSAQRSWEGMRQYLGEPEPRIEADVLDGLLTTQLEISINEIDTSSDRTKVTADAMQTLRSCFDRSRTEGMTWRDWAAINNLSIGSASEKAIENLRPAGAIVHRHPNLHADLEDYLNAIYECAVACLEAYQNYKSARGLIDFVDQEYRALDLLNNPSVKESLKSRIDLVLIDEFQDTSPIQLALFLKLAEISKRSMWVGDVKQAIYGFRGTDPGLMQEAANVFDRLPPLGSSYRSRPELVEFFNETFRLVFPEYGIQEQDVVIQPAGNRQAADGEAIELWRCRGKELESCYSSLADAVSKLLNDPERRVVDAETGESRAPRGSDIAILCRKNDHCSKLATALGDVGLKVAMIRDGLLDTPECLLAMATLRYLADKTDKVALGHIVHLTHDYNNSDQSGWLSKWLAAKYNPEKLLTHGEQLEEARQLLPGSTVSEAVNIAIDAGCVLDYVAGWGNAAERLSNLDALRGMVSEYEATCSIAGAAATVVGFLNYVLQLEDGERPASTDPHAVQVLTYHGAKGLEWPIVMLADLDSEAAPKVHKDLCRVFVEGSAEEFDVSRPLKDRWIRFWPWPFGSIEKDGHFEAHARTSPEYLATHRRVLAENVRLMYVGMTRARDLLVLASYSGRSKQDAGEIDWLNELTNNDNFVLKFPEKTGGAVLKVGGKEHRIFIREFDGKHTENQSSSSVPGIFSILKSCRREVSNAGYLSYNLRPSDLAKSSQPATSGNARVISIGERIIINGTAEMAMLGEAVHGFLAADSPNSPDSPISPLHSRLSMAERLLKSWRVTQLHPEDLLLMSDRLASFIRDQFGTDFLCHTECPVNARIGTQRLRGAIDLLIETNDAFHILDHKSFPGPIDMWESKALSFAAQLDAYRQAIQLAGSKPVKQLLIHMPLVGKIVDLSNIRS